MLFFNPVLIRLNSEEKIPYKKKENSILGRKKLKEYIND